MSKPTDIRVRQIEVYFLPVTTRLPLKFGAETLTSVTCARVAVTVEDRQGRQGKGWGETPLSVQWGWPSSLPYEVRHKAMKDFCLEISRSLIEMKEFGHPMELGHLFLQQVLPSLLYQFNRRLSLPEDMPYLAGLICLSPFDIAIHDAFGVLHNLPTYETYNEEFMNYDLSHYLTQESEDFKGMYPAQYLKFPREEEMIAWHLVGGMDPIDPSELVGDEPQDGYPVLLEDWIKEDGLKCLKVKLRGNDSEWDYERLVKVGETALKHDVWYLSADFNCTVNDPAYVTDILDRLMREHPRIYGMLLYVEQPFPYDLERYMIDVHSVSARKPLFMDESAHNWKLVKLGYGLGWTGVALKTCKTQTGALLTLCWAKRRSLPVMVQDLTNPMLAQIPHLLLASHAGTIMGVETNCMQFYPEASRYEAEVHRDIYRRRNGKVRLFTLRGAGFGYRIGEIGRPLPEPALVISL